MADDKPEKDKRLPISEVAFNLPTKIHGVSSTMVTVLEAGVRRVMDGKDWLPPKMWVNIADRVVQVGEYTYPFERVHYYRRAVAALTKEPPPLDLSRFTVGKVAKS